MQHQTSTTLSYEGPMPTRQFTKYLPYALLGATLVATQSFALLAFAALALGLTLAIQERLHKLSGKQAVPAQHFGTHLVSDGGSFPGHQPKTEPLNLKRPSVIDGGSLEHHQH